MLKLTKTGIGLLTRQYRSVLKKCFLINAGLFFALAPSAADATEVTDIFATLQQKSPHNIVWTGYSTTGTEGYDAATNKGTIKIAVDGGDYYFNYIYNTPTGYTETSLPVTEFTAENVQNKVFEQITTDINSGVIRLSSNTDSDIPVISDFIGNIASDGIAKGSSIWLESAAIGDIKGNFIGNYINATSAQAEGGAIDVDTFITTGKQAKVGKIEGIFIGNHAIANGNGISAGGAVWSQSGSIIEDIHADFIGNYTLNTAGGQASGGAIFNNRSNEYGNIIHNIYDSTFTSNYAKSESGSASGGAIYNTGTIGISAKNTDTVFRDNKTIVGSSTSYNDIDNTGTLHLNAASGRAIDFGGSITGTGTINLGNGYEGAATGGYYTFHNGVKKQYMNLYNGADVRLRGMYQEDESYTTGILKNTTTTITGTGNIISSIDNNANSGANDTQYHQSNDLGALTFNSGANLILRFDVNATGSGDLFTASSVTGAIANSIIVDRIRVYDNTTQQSVNIRFVDANLKDYINLATNVVEDTYYKDIYTVLYSKGTDGGYVTLTKNSTPHYNLVGFLSQDATGTSYTLDSDEYVYKSIGSMAGTGNTKTVNAGDYTIYGEDKSGVTVSAGQTLNINGGVWDGFVSNSNEQGGITVSGKASFNDVKFVNNSSIYGAAIYNKGGNISTITGEFLNNTGGVVKNIHSGSLITSIDGNFQNNSTFGDSYYGGAIDNNSTIGSIR
ncbi:MAG: hypothetical protein IJ677_06150, partial [Alphaproteobacteria bacterium]|nr:hypothetical protein [Alphaproteobacteria bacterium]